MKNKYWFLGLMWIAIGFSSCNDFLNCEPEDFADESAYFKTADDLKLSVNKFYDLLPKMRENNLGIHSEDNTSDNQIGTSPSNLFYMGDKRTVQQGSSAWYFTNLRGINFFINKTEQRLNNNEITGSESLINHYLGEGYFFRAYDHFRLLSNFGDCPIVTEMLPDDPATLAQATKRRPRNEVARFILSDLDKAIELLQQNAPQSGRITQDAAYLFKARVALYEATWEKYHASTCFVPGNNKWAGADYNSDFRFQSGNAQSEIQFFLDEAIAAADMVASTRQLNKDYISMFNNLGTFPDDSEVILARYYMSGIITHSCSNYLGRTGGGTGFSRSLVNSFLLTNGIPIYADSELYKGDRTLYDEMENRDLRLVNSVKGSVPTTSLDDDGNTIVNYFVPQITLTGAESATTGYQIRKWVSDEIGQDVYTQCTTSSPIFRAAEAYLIYMEAYYERFGKLDEKCDIYWKSLRQRAGVDDDYMKTIAATDLTQENDLAIKSKGNYIDATLYNIRRERRCEYIAEAMRLDDLKRWRALDEMTSYQIEGMNLWEYMYNYYQKSALTEGIVSQSGVSTYIRPLQKSATGVAYMGYNFPKQHYLEPIPISEFLLTIDSNTGKSTLYQNPGWPSASDGPADYTFDCD